MIAAVAAGLVPATAGAQLPAPTPIDDDIAFLSFATVAARHRRAAVVGLRHDPATRLFLGRLLAYDAEQVAWLRGASGHASPTGLFSPIDLEAAAAELDAFLSTPDFPD